MTTFKDFQLPKPIESALEAMQFTTPTPIQTQAIPVAINGQDLIGIAQTGTGKTAAFCLPILARLLNSQANSALVLVPTRELAIQVNTFWMKLTQKLPQMNSTLVMGGTNMQQQSRGLSRKPRLIVATPGRLVDHLKRRSARIDAVDILVLDEADRMLDMGFAPQLSEILRHLPQSRQTLFFTATWANELDKLAKKYLHQPVRVTVGEISRAAPMVEQTLVMTTAPKKNEALLEELNKRPGSVLVFTRTKSRTDRVARYLAGFGVEVNRLHGGRSQGQRNVALTAFRTGKIRVLVATDIAARGIDVKEIAHVVNYDLPQSSDDYIHRIGRTGRAGAAGQAVSLVTPEDRAQWREISKLLEKTGSQVPTHAGMNVEDRSSRPSGPSGPSGGGGRKQRPRGNQQPRGDRQQRPNERGKWSSRSGRSGRSRRPQSSSFAHSAF